MTSCRRFGLELFVLTPSFGTVTVSTVFVEGHAFTVSYRQFGLHSFVFEGYILGGHVLDVSFSTVSF